MRVSRPLFTKLFLSLVLLTVLFLTYITYDSFKTVPAKSRAVQNPFEVRPRGTNASEGVGKGLRAAKRDVEIWGKASIAEYLWTHVLEATANTYSSGLLKHGETTIGNLHFTFRSGPGIIQTTVPTNVRYLILVLNGKDDAKVKFSKSWLDYLVHFHSLRRVALIVLGDEKCDNGWMLPYLRSRGGVVDAVFLIYDSPLIDDKEFFQWPLGVATYRGFPNFKSSLIQIESPRRYLCNFLGTIYKNSSRETLQGVLDRTDQCYFFKRESWIPSESYESMERYIRVLTESDLTLNPVGQNSECYRIYEALSLGSMPVVENVVTPGECDTGRHAPLRLLKRYNAPITLINDWTELDGVLKAESKLTLTEKVERRKRIVKWYENFKFQMRHRFLEVIKSLFS